MKVFQVKSIHCKDDGGIVEIIQYATHKNNDLLSITEYFTRHFDSIGDELQSVAEVLVITNHIGMSD